MVPEHADVVVFLLRTVNCPLNGISTVVDDEDDGFEAKPDIRANFLDSHLERSLANDEHDPTWPQELFGSNAGAEAGADSVPNGRPEGLGDVADVLGESRVWHAELRSASFREHDVVGFEEAADALP